MDAFFAFNVSDRCFKLCCFANLPLPTYCVLRNFSESRPKLCY